MPDKKMLLTPEVSIIMPTYNCGRYIQEAIDSVRNQSFSNWELIVIDDCSLDDTASIMRKYQEKDPRIYYECFSKNQGPAAARTRALQLAAGRYVAFLDSDDIWFPDKLEKQITFMKNEKIAFSATGYNLIDENGKSLGKESVPPKRTDYNKMFYLGDPVGNLTVIYDQYKIGKQQVPNIRKRNDYALWLQILRQTDYCYGMKEVLASYRKHTSSISNNKWKLIRYQWHLYRNIEQLNLCKCTLGIITWALIKKAGLQYRKEGTAMQYGRANTVSFQSSGK